MVHIDQHTSEAVLRAFRRAATFSWYRALLDERRIDPSEITDVAAFCRRCPRLRKENTFDRFHLHELAAAVDITSLAGVLTSSGHGGRFSFGLSTRAEAEAGADLIDQALEAAFQIRSRSTLVINCLPMGVGFSSACATVATVSVREDMAVALVDRFGPYYDQLVLVGDPLFLKRLTDYAAERALDWRRFRVHVVVGEEIFGERFREYVSGRLGLDPERPRAGYLMSSFGVGELGLHLCYETPATIALRRLAASRADVARDVLGATDDTLPMVLAYEPRRTFIESLDADPDGYGEMTVSMLDPERPIPLLRYQTGDIVRMLDRDAIVTSLERRGLALPFELPASLLALKGRAKDRLPNGLHSGAYKDALYAVPDTARRLTGAVRLVFSGKDCTVHVQLAPGMQPDASTEATLRRVFPIRHPADRVVLWPYERFPFGMSLDYERKFRQYVAGEGDPCFSLDPAAAR